MRMPIWRISNRQVPFSTSWFWRRAYNTHLSKLERMNAKTTRAKTLFWLKHISYEKLPFPEILNVAFLYPFQMPNELV